MFYNGKERRKEKFIQRLSDSYETSAKGLSADKRCMELKEAAESAVAECIEKDIIKDFFLEQRSEVVVMSIYEYNEEYIRRELREDGYAEGYSEGETQGRRKGLTEAVDVIVKEFHIDWSEACEIVGLNEKDYMDEKQIKNKYLSMQN